MKNSGKSIKSFLINYMYLLSAIIVVFAFYLLKPSFLSLYSIQNIALEIAPLLMMSLGVSFVLYTGCIDLSTGAVASCACVLTGTYIAKTGSAMILLMLLYGILVGVITGTLVTRLKIPSFIVTLCAQSIWKCVALVQSGGGSLNIPMNSRYLVKWASEKVLFFPALFWIAMAILLLMSFVERRTIIGKIIFATGANEKAARIAGINTRAAKLCAYIFSGVGSAIAGLMYAYKLKSSVPNVGDSLNLMAISAVALGGTLMSGGRGSVWRTFVGVITITAISSGMNMIGVDALWKDIIYGIVLIVAVAANTEKGSRQMIVK